MGLADLHIHSINSYDGICTIPAILKYVSDETDLNVIAITDHDSMDGVGEAKALAHRYGIEVIPGCEISTAEGHLLGLFIDHPVKPGLSLVETVKRVGRMGGLCIAPHPTARGMGSLSFESIWKSLGDPEVRKTLVGVEAFNGSLVDTSQNSLVYKSAGSLPLAQFGNSDAHTLSLIGSGATRFEGKTAADLRAAILEGRTEVHINKEKSGFGVLMDYIPRFMLRMLGWAIWNSGPREPLTYERLSRIELEKRIWKLPAPDHRQLVPEKVRAK
jgi:predicted metal-dependent phosphoesterase TrpH